MTHDRELIRAFVEAAEPERQAAFRSLVDRHGPMVGAVCRRLAGADGDDAAQAVFLVLARRARELADHPELGGWLHRTAVQVALRQRESRGIRKRHEQEAGMTGQADSGLDPTLRVELREELDAALDALPARYRAPLVLHYLEGQEQVDVTATLAMSVGTLTSLLSRARQLLRQRLERRGVGVSLALLAVFLGGKAAAATAAPAVGAGLACQVAAAGSGPISGVSAPVTALAEAHLRATSAAALSTSVLVTVATIALLAAATAVWWLAVAAPRGIPATVAVTVPVAPTRPAPAPSPVQAEMAPAPPAAPAPTMDEEDRRVFAAFPPAVQAAFTRLAAGGPLRGCEREQRHGREVYVAEVAAANGIGRDECAVAADGTVLSRKAEPDDGDDGKPEPPPAKAQDGAAF
jgi:RNA polymerase sigma factor (sigma-70 family)